MERAQGVFFLDNENTSEKFAFDENGNAISNPLNNQETDIEGVRLIKGSSSSQNSGVFGKTRGSSSSPAPARSSTPISQNSVLQHGIPGKKVELNTFSSTSSSMERTSDRNKDIPTAVSKSTAAKITSFSESLHTLAELIANATESYTAAIFLADAQERMLYLGGAHTLSRDFIPDAQIPYGSGLVGWAAENNNRISVCPFENDATTLRYYAVDQGLKSFIAVPVFNKNDALVGVVACDSKKSYAFSKTAEKILIGCASQAAALIELYRHAAGASKAQEPSNDALRDFVEKLHGCDSEKALLTLASDIPQELLPRDGMVVLALAEEGIGAAAFYSTNPQSRAGNRLFELVSKHKRVICGDRSVQATPSDDEQQRSFLSVPFRFLGREAGSFNLLSKPKAAFEGQQIALLEYLAGAVSRELERHRLRDRYNASLETTGVSSWKFFNLQARALMKEAKTTKLSLSLLRLHLRNLQEIEDLVGPTAAVNVMQKLMRLIDQIKREPAIACYLYGFQVLMLVPSAEADKMVSRLCALVERLTPADLGVNSQQTGIKLGKLLTEGLQISKASYPRDGETLEVLTAKTLRLIELAEREKPTELVRHAGNWS